MPIFSVDDVQQAIDIWSRELGFTVWGVVRDEESNAIMHAELSLDGVPIMVGPRQDDSPVGGGNIAFYVYLERDIDAYYEQVKAQSGVTVCQEIVDQWWKDRMFTIQDSLGYYWTFAHAGGEPNPPEGTTWEPAETEAARA